MRKRPFFWAGAAGLALLGMGYLLVGGATVWLNAQEEPASRLSFEVIESFDAKYLGDTPGHMGRVGGLAARRPKVALGDPVFRGEEMVGTVTGLVWNRTNGSVDIEFDPAPLKVIVLGDTVWVSLRNDGDRTEPGPGKPRTP
jgi:hypothetical protein